MKWWRERLCESKRSMDWTMLGWKDVQSVCSKQIGAPSEKYEWCCLSTKIRAHILAEYGKPFMQNFKTYQWLGYYLIYWAAKGMHFVTLKRNSLRFFLFFYLCRVKRSTFCLLLIIWTSKTILWYQIKIYVVPVVHVTILETTYGTRSEVHISQTEFTQIDI